MSISQLMASIATTYKTSLPEIGLYIKTNSKERVLIQAEEPTKSCFLIVGLENLHLRISPDFRFVVMPPI